MPAKRFYILWFLLVSSTQPALSQLPDQWRLWVHRSGLDTTGVRFDSAGISRLAYETVYGIRPQRLSYWQLPERIDSTKINRAVQALLRGQPDWQTTWQSIEPVFEPYRRLRQALDSLYALHTDSLPSLPAIRSALNEYRWLNRLSTELVVVVNIPSASLRVFNRQGVEVLPSRVIVGSPRTTTPLFGAQITRIVTFPYWNVPRSIAIRELLPKIKRNPVAVLDAMKMQVLDAQGRVVAPETIAWNTMSATHFPYRLRQSTGCDNALGVMKFDLNSPFDIYLHDTNHRELFAQANRQLSHGCVRVARPVELANLLLGKPYFSSAFLESRQTNVSPQTVPLPQPIPVVIQYQTVEVDASGKLRFFRDVYGWQTTKL